MFGRKQSLARVSIHFRNSKTLRIKFECEGGQKYIFITVTHLSQILISL